MDVRRAATSAPRSSGAPAPTPPLPGRTGLERECLRQAVHDLRGPLNTASVLLDLVVALGVKDPALASTKAAMVVRELHSLARMLHNLVGSSDTFASVLTPVDLGAALDAAVVEVADAARARSVAIVRDGEAASPWIDACPVRLHRALVRALDTSIASLPEGGEVRARIVGTDESERVRLQLDASGPRIAGNAQGRPHLTASSDAADAWFAVLALVRGVGGELELVRGEGALRSTLDFPRAPVRAQ